MPIVRELVVKGVTGDALPNPARHRKRGIVSEGNKSDGGNNLRTYRLLFPAKAEPRPCPVEGCSGWAST